LGEREEAVFRSLCLAAGEGEGVWWQAGEGRRRWCGNEAGGERGKEQSVRRRRSSGQEDEEEVC
jgi:hypothetical protein